MVLAKTLFKGFGLALLVLIVGIAFVTFLGYAVLGLVQMTMFLMDLISRGGYG